MALYRCTKGPCSIDLFPHSGAGSGLGNEHVQNLLRSHRMSSTPNDVRSQSQSESPDFDERLCEFAQTAVLPAPEAAPASRRFWSE